VSGVENPRLRKFVATVRHFATERINDRPSPRQQDARNIFHYEVLRTDFPDNSAKLGHEPTARVVLSSQPTDRERCTGRAADDDRAGAEFGFVEEIAPTERFCFLWKCNRARKVGGIGSHCSFVAVDGNCGSETGLLESERQPPSASENIDKSRLVPNGCQPIRSCPLVDHYAL